jgi:hypothetical protein
MKPSLLTTVFLTLLITGSKIEDGQEAVTLPAAK